MVFFLSCYFMYKIFLRRPDGSMCSENGLILCFNGLSSCVLLLTSFFCLAQRSSKGSIELQPSYSLTRSKLNPNKICRASSFNCFRIYFIFDCIGTCSIPSQRKPLSRKEWDRNYNRNRICQMPKLRYLWNI